MSFEEIIVEIQKEPSLWMSADPNYKNRQFRGKLWAEIATKLGIGEEVLKKRWKHLKDQYRKELKKKCNLRSGIEGEECVSSWKYFRSMEFIKYEVLPYPYNGNINPYEGDRTMYIQKEEDSTDVDFELADSYVASPASQHSSEPSMSQPRPSSKRKGNVRSEMLEIERKKIKLLEETLGQSSEEDNLRNDTDYLFLRSILPSMKKLDDYQKLCFRGKINDWLLEALDPNKNLNSLKKDL